MANRINLIKIIKTVADTNSEAWDGFSVREPDGFVFTDEFTDEEWNKYVVVPEESKVTAASVRSLLPQHVKDLALESIQIKRMKEYPNWGTQLDYIYHNGIDKWKTEVVDPVKKKYPKPE